MSQIETKPDQSAEPTSDERLMAALAHGSVVISFLGPIGPILIWISQRRKSAYASFHALQAMGYQMFFFWVGIAMGFVVAILWVCLLIPIFASLETDSRSLEFAPFAFEGGFFLLIFSLWGLYMAGGVIGAFRCLLKYEFDYPVLGKKLKAYLAYDPGATVPIDEAKEDRWVAAMGHGSAILLMWGLTSPLAVWITQKDRSRYLRLQALQAFVYQLLALLAYFGFMAIYFFSIIALAFVLPLAPSPDSGLSNLSLGGLLIFGILILAVWLVILLAIPAYHLFAMIAAIETLKGKDYRYPLLGKFIEQRLNPDRPAN